MRIIEMENEWEMLEKSSGRPRYCLMFHHADGFTYPFSFKSFTMHGSVNLGVG